jgi:Holliday junction resolvasome RuvABC endonuclease subunit
MKKNVLGMDISSSTIGWSLVEFEEDAAGKGCDAVLVDYGHLKPPPSKAGSLTVRINDAYDSMNELFLRLDPDFVAIENYANKFSSGRSSARTIIVLSVFNELSALACLRALGVEPVKYNVITIRSRLSKFFNKTIKSKDDTFDFVCEYFSNFEVRKNRNDGVKKECYDEADSIAVSLCYIISKTDKGKRLWLK